MRFDVNVNLEITKNGNLYKTPICEVKNLNSFRSMERAIEYESKRQLDEFEENGIVLAKGNKTTRGWNDNLSKTFFQRDKEESDDYRYFPEPDLPPLILSEAFIKDAISSIDILPTDAYNSLINKYSLSKDIAELIIEERDYYDFFMSTSLKYKNYINLSNWITTEILGIIKEHSLNISDIDKYTLIKILESIDKKIISVSSGKEILRSVILDKTNVDILIEKNSISSDSGKVDSIINKVLVSHKDTVEKYLEGKEGVLGFLIGQVVREMDGRVDPKDVREKILVVINKIHKN